MYARPLANMATPQPDLSGGPVLLSFSLATSSFALATTFVRFCVRAGIYKHIGADDYAVGVASVSVGRRLNGERGLTDGSWWH